MRQQRNSVDVPRARPLTEDWGNLSALLAKAPATEVFHDPAGIETSIRILLKFKTPPHVSEGRISHVHAM